MIAESALDAPVASIVVTTSRYQFSPEFSGSDVQTVARHLQEFYNQVDIIDEDWLRLGFWERKPTFGRLKSGEVIAIKEIMRPYFLRPSSNFLDTFSIQPGGTTSDYLLSLRHPLVTNKFVWTPEDLWSSDYPLYSVMWDEPENLAERIGPSRSVKVLDGDKWSQIPQSERELMQAGLNSWSIQTEYRDPSGLIVKGATFVHQGGVLLYLATPESEVEEFNLMFPVGRILDILYAGGPATLFN